MKVMKLALLGTAALAAVSVSARADDLADLKAQIEALNSRISQLEAAPAVPAGYQLLSVSQAPAIVVPTLDIDPAYGATATNIGILPTADVPASTTIQWSGFVRAAVVYDTDERAVGGADEDIDVETRGELKVVGTTDTAVGEVGALVKLRVDFDGVDQSDFTSPEYWGWWKMTPELTLGGGFTGTLANIGYGYDGACNCYETDNADVAFNPGDAHQLRLSYASGPLSFAIALEDGTVTGASDDSLGVAGEIKYAGDTFSAEVSAGAWDEDDYLGGSASDGVEWQVGAGLGFSFDPINISLAAAAGEMWSESEYWGVSALVSANLSDSVHAEIAAGYKDWDSTFVGDYDVTAVLAGIYYDPVAQLTIGLEGEWEDDESAADDTIQVDLVTVFRF